MTEHRGLRLHHVGYVVENVEAAMPGFMRSLQGSWDGQIFEDPLQKVRVAFLTTDTRDALFELVQPAASDSPVSRFLQDRGGGLHHCCYEVDDLETSIASMQREGSVLTKRPKPAVAFAGRPVAWLLTREKLLVELLQRG